MSTYHLPLVEPHRREHTYCAHCPKLCRHSCPVSTVQARETTTPWAKMTMLHHVDHGRLPLSEETSRSFYACTGCMRCATYCDHGNRVGLALGAGRAEAVLAGAAPSTARDVIRRHGDRSARAARSARDLLGAAALERHASVVFVPGCTALVADPAEATAGFRVVSALTRAMPRVEAGGCCGLPLLDAGDVEGFRQSAKRWHDRLASADLVVFGDPGCQHALTRLAPELGVPSTLPEARHVSELAAARLSEIPPIEGLGRLRYLDPCRLGRGLGIYDAPRATLSRLAGAPPEELYHRREHAECAGGGGQLPRTDRPTADAIARERLADHDRAGGGTLVAACPAQARRLRSQSSAAVRTLTDLLARALGAAE